MSKTEVPSQRPRQRQGSIFQCNFCGNTYLSREIPYNDLGYAVCPVCHYEHGPQIED